MTRVSVNRTLNRLYWLLTIVLLLLLASKFADDIPGLPPFVISTANKVYDFMRDMSLLIATGGVAYLSNIFQKRSKFVESLEEEWRNIVRTKSVLLSTCEKPYLATDDYLAAWRARGFPGEYVPMPGTNHFDLVLTLNDPKSPLTQAILRQMGLAGGGRAAR